MTELPNSTLISIDMQHQSLPLIDDSLEERWLRLEGNSQKLLPKLAKLSIQPDLIFIDGDHSYRGARLDFYNSLKLLAPNGTIIIHDINFRRVRKGIFSICPKDQFEYHFTNELHKWYGLAVYHK